MHLQEEDAARKGKLVEEKIGQQRYLIKKKHKKETTAFEMKIKSNWLRLWQQRERDLDVLRKRYKNSQFDLIQKYKQDCLRVKTQSPITKMEIKESLSQFPC